MAPDRDWIQEKLTSLTKHSDGLKDVGSTSDDPEFGAWTALKLVVFTAAVDVYSTIMAANNFDFYYIDAMSGSGLVHLTDRNDTLIGSPFIAGTVAHEPFSKMYFIEDDPERADSLRKRLDYAVDEIDAFQQSREDCVVIDGDANDVLPEIPDQIKRLRGGTFTGTDGKGGAHHLAFIDNERFEVKFPALRQLENKMYGDLLINYQETGLNRARGRLLEGLDEDWSEYLAFFDGDERARIFDAPDERFELYLEKIDSLKRPVHESVAIRGSTDYPFVYRMVYATRRTSGGSEFIEFMRGQKDTIGKLTGDDIEIVLDTMRGDATHLGLFSMSEEEDDDGQASLGEYGG